MTDPRPQRPMRLRKGHTIPDAPADERDLHRARMDAALPLLGPHSYFCKASAAVVHGLPLWHADLDRPHVVHAQGGHGEITGVLHSYRPPQVPPETVRIGDLPVTSLARTAADLMRVARFGPALAIADAALRRGASRGDLLANVRTGRGCRHATEAARRADPLSESPYESLARALMLQHGVPLPSLQVTFTDRFGFVGRVDFHWPRHRVVGEFDGEVKLTDLLAPGQTRDDVLTARRLRDERLRGLGLTVLHWDKDDIHNVAPFIDSLRLHLGETVVDHGLCPEAFDHRRSRARERRPRPPRT